MLDHVVILCSDLGASRGFCEEALAPLGMGIVVDLAEIARSVGFGAEGKPGA